MGVINVNKNLLCAEDVTSGVGKITQTRGDIPLELSKLNPTEIMGALVVPTINDMLLLTVADLGNTKTVIVQDKSRGGTFSYDGTQSLINDGGTILNGWVRQYDGTADAKWFGAVGDGITDDTLALQKWLDLKGYLSISNGDFVFTDTLTIKENTTIVSNEAIIRKSFIGTGIRNTNWINPGTQDLNIKIYGLKVRQGSALDRGNLIELINVENVLIDKLDILQTATFSTTGAWSLYLSGKNIEISEPNIDSRNGGLYADGIHCAYVEDLYIHGGRIHAGDDAIALFPPDSLWENSGKDLPSKNILISDMMLGSTEANLIRVGAGDDVYFGGNSLPNVTYDNVKFSNIVDISNVTIHPNRKITIVDRRIPANIVGKHNRLVFENITFNSPGTAGFIGINGNPDITNILNIGQHNFGKITFSNIVGNNTSNGYSFYGGGCDVIEIDRCKFERDFIATTSTFLTYMIDKLLLNDSVLYTGATGTTGTGFTIKNTLDFEMSNTKTYSVGEFRAWNIVSNASQSTKVNISDSKVFNSLIGFDNTDATGYDELLVSNTYVEGSNSKLTAGFLNSLASDIKLVGDYATSSGTSGGVGSAGVGTQFVEIEVGGVIYKVLHDGIV